MINFIFLGNEALCDRTGYEAGACLILNGGNMNHSSLLSENGGLSKSLIMTVSYMVAPQPIDVPMNYEHCWSPLDMRRCHVRHFIMVEALCEGLTLYFWVSFSLSF